MKLVIVESPAKAKTIAKYLGEGYAVDASGGHVSDLPAKELGVDTENGFKPTYIVNPTKKEVIKRLQGKVKSAETVYLATDPDREGEAISWHLQNVLKLDKKAQNRIVFNEITKKAVQEAIQKPRCVDGDLVNAQQARRVLDRLVGYKLSPVLCKKIKGKLSAGRVQSAALKIVVDREREIRAFVPEEYWTVNALLQKQDGTEPAFKATLAEKGGRKFKITCKDECDKVLADIKGKGYSISQLKRAEALSSPQPPFTTSTLQQEAGNKLNMPSKLTMQIAQQLYEGVDLMGEGHTALVTYIRTDSVRVAAEAQAAAKEYLLTHYGKAYVPAKYNFYKSKKESQDAHEAIRPVSLERTPDSLKDGISKDQYRVYKLIYERFLASQSTKAVFDTVSVTADCVGYGFKAVGKTMTFDGYTRIYAESKPPKDEDNAKLPPLSEGEKLDEKGVTSEQKFTKPPSRYTESSLVKTMEENGIGRPSTYSAIMTTLYNREYTVLDKKAIVPTELGFTVTEYLERYFDDIVDAEFTAQMEDKLDLVEEGKADWVKIVGDFYGPFYQKIKSTDKNGEKVKLQPEVSDQFCDKCGAPMLIKDGRYGKYLACSAYPECKNIVSLKKKAEPVVTDVICDKCGKPMLERSGRYGKYLACSGYPDCKNIKSVTEPICKCPVCKTGSVIKRQSAKGKVFYGCSNYPECKFSAWDKPAPFLCEKCGGIMVLKTVKDQKEYRCIDTNCGHSVPCDE